MLGVGVNASSVQHSEALKLGIRQVDRAPAFTAKVAAQFVATFVVAVLVTFDFVFTRDKGQFRLEHSQVICKSRTGRLLAIVTVAEDCATR